MVENRKGYDIIINTVMVILCVLCLVPFILLVSASFTAESSLAQEGCFLWPREFSTEAYELLIRGSNIPRAYLMSALVTVSGTAMGLLITTLLAYPLSLPDLPGRRTVSFLIFFTMLFSGGLIPSYMMWTRIFHIKNTFAALLFPSLVTNGFTVMMMRSYFQTNVPPELLESARIDGAKEGYILFKIVLPISLPIFATVGMMTALTYWNDWSNNLYYITDSRLNTIQGLLNRLLKETEYISKLVASGQTSAAASAPTTSARMAVVVLGTLPILCVYPFFQKYFVKGMTLGAVKG